MVHDECLRQVVYVQMTLKNVTSAILMVMGEYVPLCGRIITGKITLFKMLAQFCTVNTEMVHLH